jgi:hypothetical protein
MAEVQTVLVQIEPPKGTFNERAVEGCYTVENDFLTLTNRRGEPVRDAEGNGYTHKLEPGDNPKQVAGLLTKKFRKVRRGNNTPARGFSVQSIIQRRGGAKMAFSTAFQPGAFQLTAFQIGVADSQPGSEIVAQTSRTPLYPKAWRELERAMAAKARRERSWDELPELIKLRLQLEQFQTEKAELLDFSGSGWAQHRITELTALIGDTKRKIARWEEAEAFRKAHGLRSKVFKN